MKLPNGDNAVVDMQKLRGYCLSATHPRGRHKARVFASALGIYESDADLLRDALWDAASNREVMPDRTDIYGQRYILDFEIHGPAGSEVVRSFWMVRAGESFPRLTSCFVM
jgi:hypothetical protein